MATCAEFLVMQKDGSFLQSALLYDGYPSNVVPHLLTTYKKKDAAQVIANAGDFESLDDPAGTKVLRRDGTDGPVKFLKMPARKAVFAEYCYVYTNNKWHIMEAHNCLIPLQMPVKIV